MDIDKIKQKSGKRDFRAPDAFTAELKRGFEWSTTHTTIVVVLVVGFLLVGGGMAIWKYTNTKNEKAAQEKYFEIESQVMKKKEAFAAAKAPKPPMAKDAKKEEKPKEEAATGDFAKDYGDLPQQLKSFVEQNNKTKAGAMAALTLAGLESEYKKDADALETLKKVQTSGVLSALVKMQMATLTANNGNCAEALPMFEQIISDPSSAFMKLEAKLKIALCSESTGNLAKAEDNLNQVIVEGKQNPVARSAQKYLRLLQIKKASEGKAD